MNIHDFNKIQEDEKNLQKAKDRFFSQYKVETESFRSKLYFDNSTRQLCLEIVPTGKDPFVISGEDIKIFYNLLTMLFNANEIKKDAETFKKKELKKSD